MNSCVWGNERMYFATWGWRPVRWRHAGAVSKADDGDQNILVGATAGELLRDVGTQLVYREARGVHYQVGELADGLQHAALAVQRVLDRGIFPQRMRPAGF